MTQRCPVFNSGDKWSGCAARVHVLTQGALSPLPTGSAASNGRRAGTGESRDNSTESKEPETKRPDGLTTREGLNLAGRHDHRWSCPRALRPTGRASRSEEHT